MCTKNCLYYFHSGKVQQFHCAFPHIYPSLLLLPLHTRAVLTALVLPACAQRAEQTEWQCLPEPPAPGVYRGEGGRGLAAALEHHKHPQNNLRGKKGKLKTNIRCSFFYSFKSV